MQHAGSKRISYRYFLFIERFSCHTYTCTDHNRYFENRWEWICPIIGDVFCVTLPFDVLPNSAIRLFYFIYSTLHCTLLFKRNKVVKLTWSNHDTVEQSSWRVWLAFHSLRWQTDKNGLIDCDSAYRSYPCFCSTK